MKTPLTAVFLLAGLFFVSTIVNSCAKADHSADLPIPEQLVGKWSINRIQLKIYSGGVFIKDTIVKQSPKPENFVSFGANGSFEYRFNTNKSDVGTYSFSGLDSVVSSSTPNNYKWKLLLVTNKTFTTVSTGTDPAYPGCVVERYHSFLR